MITFNFISTHFPDKDLDEKKIKAKKFFLDFLENYRASFENAETYVDVDLDKNTYGYTCKNDLSNLVCNFREFKKNKQFL
jgi:hypothetical protein